MTEERGELKAGEPHPAAESAKKWFNDNYNFIDILRELEVFSSCAIENNRLAEICVETLRRIRANEPISDRYLLGLVWTLKNMEDR